jgi:hypothetical protein
VLLVEDDRGDAILVEELIADAAADITCVWAQSLSDAERELAIDKLKEAYAIHTRARGAAPTPVAPLRSH